MSEPRARSLIIHFTGHLWKQRSEVFFWPLGEQPDTEIGAGFISAFGRKAEPAWLDR
jgi:hypothetical protein